METVAESDMSVGKGLGRKGCWREGREEAGRLVGRCC